MTSNSVVRRATPEDHEGIWELLDLVHEENAVLTQSKLKIDWYLDRILHPELIAEGDTGVRGFIGVIGPVGALEGMIIICLGTMWYSDDILLEEYVNFVHPKHRKSDHAKTLVSYAKHIADKTGTPLLIGIVSNTRTAAKVRLYRRQLPECGSFFLYNATAGSPKEQTMNGKAT